MTKYVPPHLRNASSSGSSSFLNSECTFRQTRRHHKPQVMIVCRTCWPNDPNSCVCLACANYCHFGHELSAVKELNGFCDCGAEQKCCNRNPFFGGVLDSSEQLGQMENKSLFANAMSEWLQPFQKQNPFVDDSKQLMLSIGDRSTLNSSLNAFALALLKQIVSGNQSFIASPFNIWNVMSLAYLWSSEDAKLAMEKTGVWSAQQLTLLQLRYLKQIVSKSSNQLKAGYWLLHRLPLKANLTSQLITQYKLVETVALSDDDKKAVQQVNETVSKNTNKLIP